MSFFATAEHERERLKYFASPEGRDDLYRYNQKERRTVLEVRSMNYMSCMILLLCRFIIIFTRVKQLLRMWGMVKELCLKLVHECKRVNETIIDKVWWFLSLYSIMMHK